MFQWLKDHFIPHEGNDHRPHFLRAPATALILAGILVLEVAYLTGTLYIIPRSAYLAEVIASVLVEETNDVRAADALGTLTVNLLLQKAAELKAEDMAARGYFSHNTPDGRTPWTFLQEVGYRYQAAGENLAVNFTDSSDVTRAWMNSPSHRANILNGNYTEIGIATARGMYKGHDAIFVVQFFGRPRFADLPQTASSAPTELPERLAEEIPAPTPVLGAQTQAEDAPLPVLPVALDEPPLFLAQATTAELRVGTEDSAVASMTLGTDTPTTTADVLAPELSFATTVAPASMDKSNFLTSTIQRVLAMPRATLTAILLSIAVIVLVALILTIFVKVHIQHPHLIANAIIIVSIIAAVLLLNALFSQFFGVVY